MVNKANLRQALIAKRAAIAPALRAQWDEILGEKLLAWWNANRLSTLAVYWPIRQEPDLHRTYARLAESGARLALPVVAQKEAPLVFAQWQPGDEVVKDAYGVFVPAVQTLVQPDALLIPCVGFNEKRFRLGYGGGFYDRTLALTPKPRAIGIAYACQLAEFDADPHDIALDAVITEQRCL